MRIYIHTCLVAFATFPAAQALGLGDVPKCAQPCANNLPSECNVIDVACICASSSWISSISCCVKTACSEDDQRQTIEIATGLCKGKGVTLPTVATCSAGAPTTAPGSTQSSIAGSTSSGSSSSSAIAASEQSSLSATAGSRTATTTNTIASSTSRTTSASSSSPAAVSNAAAPVRLLAQGIGAAGAAAFALALI